MDGSGEIVRSLSVLVAEDNPTNSMIFEAFLSNLGHVATVVEDGGKALSQWRDGTFDLILMDVRMPVMNGVEATEAIRRHEAERGGPRIPIIAISAHDDAAVIEDCLSHGMDGYVSKPCGMAALAEALRPYVDAR